MPKIPVIAVFDIGKTNKKMLLFSEQYNLLDQRSERTEELLDEDGFPSDDLMAIQRFVFSNLDWIINHGSFELKAVNFSAYGASFVHIGTDGRPITPLYSYLKPFSQALLDEFLEKYGGPSVWSRETASPVLGSLNSGLQLYRLRKEKPEIYRSIKYSLHLPQWLSYLLTRKPASDPTSIGCHTGLWDFVKQDYHTWVKQEGIDKKLAPIVPSTHQETVEYKGQRMVCGVGLHDSSAALVPYFQKQPDEPFALISTGTWCITLNPFNNEPLTDDKLLADCLCYLSYKGQPVKASRLFAGQEHDTQVKRIAAHFGIDPHDLSDIQFNETLAKSLKSPEDRHPVPLPEQIKQGQVDQDIVYSIPWTPGQPLIEGLRFRRRPLAGFSSVVEAYHQLMIDLVELQLISMNYVVGKDISLVYIDGGFSRNECFLSLLRDARPDIRFVPSDLAQASALGAAMTLQTA
jgi:sugar (pentulose or hexulose) kinase